MQQKPNHQPLFKLSKWVSKRCSCSTLWQVNRGAILHLVSRTSQSMPSGLGINGAETVNLGGCPCSRQKTLVGALWSRGWRCRVFSPVRCWGQSQDTGKTVRTPPYTLQVPIIAALQECRSRDTIIANFLFRGFRLFDLDWPTNI